MAATGIPQLRAVADYQFGAGAGAALFPVDEEGATEIRRSTSGRPQQVLAGAGRIVSYNVDGRFTLGLEGGRRLTNVFPVPRCRVNVGAESVPFVCDGKNAFCKFVRRVDPAIRSGDEVLVTYDAGDEEDTGTGNPPGRRSGGTRRRYDGGLRDGSGRKDQGRHRSDGVDERTSQLSLPTTEQSGDRLRRHSVDRSRRNPSWERRVDGTGRERLASGRGNRPVNWPPAHERRPNASGLSSRAVFVVLLAERSGVSETSNERRETERIVYSASSGSKSSDAELIQ